MDGDPKALQKMVRYCKKDVVLLERVFEKLEPYYAPKTHVGVLSGDERWTCPYCGSGDVHKSKTRVTPKGMKQHQLKCKECNKYFTVSDLVFRQYLSARYGEYAAQTAA